MVAFSVALFAISIPYVHINKQILINISIAIPQIIIQHLTGATSGAGTVYPSGAPEFDLVFLLVSVGNMLFMLSSSFFYPCCNIRVLLHKNDVCIVSTLICFVGGSCFIYVICINLLCLLVKQELLTRLEHLSLPPY